MALTRVFKETVQTRARLDPTFRRALLREGIACLVGREMKTGKIVLRDYFQAAVRGRTTFSR